MSNRLLRASLLPDETTRSRSVPRPAPVAWDLPSPAGSADIRDAPLDLAAADAGHTVPPSARRRRTRWLGLAVFALLATYATLAFTASLNKGISFDEGLQIAVGYNIWLNHDLRIEGANGDLIKRWATLPFLISRPHFVDADDPLWKGGLAYDLAYRFFFELGNRPEALLQQGRAMIALLGVATGLLIFLWSRKLFGAAGGLVSLALFAFSPNMLAFGGVVSTDMSITLTLLGSTWCIWRLLHRVTVRRVLASLAFFGLMLLAKPTALVIFPITVVLVTVKLIHGGALAVCWRGRERRLATRRAQAGMIVALVVLHAIAGWSAIWAHYEFRYRASPNPADPSLVIFKQPTRDAVPAALARIVAWSERTHVFPEGYWKGIDALLGNDDECGAFMGGEWKIGGWASFFPYTIAVKTPPSLFLLLVLGGAAWWRARRAAPPPTSPENPSALAPWSRLAPPPPLYALTPHLALIACYLAVATLENLNIGHRHVLPIYPSLFVLAGAVGLGWGKRTGPLALAVVAALGWLVAESFAVRPHYLTYFAPQTGGPEKGYQHLVDSSLDWGMDLPALRDWLDQHDPRRHERLFLAYFGTDNPHYYGIKSRRLPGFFDRRNLEHYLLKPGYYAISASIFQGVYTAAFGPWSEDYERLYRITIRNLDLFAQTASNPAKRNELLQRTSPEFWNTEFDRFDNLRFARLCAWLRHQGPPPHQVAHSIFIWKLDYADLKAAVVDAPVELVATPGALRRFRHYDADGH